MGNGAFIFFAVAQEEPQVSSLVFSEALSSNVTSLGTTSQLLGIVS